MAKFITTYEPGRRRKASVSSRGFGNLLRQYPKQGTWVVGLIFFKEELLMEQLMETVKERLLAIPRFRSKMDLVKGEFVELDTGELDWEYHVRNHEEQVSLSQVYDYAGSAIEDLEIDFSKPLWQFTLYKLEDGRSLLLANISHAIGDGVSLVDVLMRLLDVDEGDLEKMESLRPPPKRRNRNKIGVFTKARVMVSGFIDGVARSFMNFPDEPNSLYIADKKNTSPRKRVAISDAISLQKVKQIKNQYEGATMNDIIVTLLTLTLRSYYRDIGDEKVLRGAKVTSSFPVSMRKPHADSFRDSSPHNKFAVGHIRYPFKSKASRADMVWIVKRRLDLMKHSPSIVVNYAIVKWLLKHVDYKKINQALIERQPTSMLSNVAGPQDVATLAGVDIDQLSFLLFSPVGLYLGVLSYNNKIWVSVNADPSLAAPEELTTRWNTEFEALYQEVIGDESDAAALETLE